MISIHHIPWQLFSIYILKTSTEFIFQTYIIIIIIISSGGGSSSSSSCCCCCCRGGNSIHKHYSVCCKHRLPIWTSFIPFSFWPLHINFLFPLSSQPFQLHQSMLSTIFLCSLFHYGSHFFLGILSLFIFVICPYHFNPSNLINFVISGPCNKPCISSWVHIFAFFASLLDNNFFPPSFLSFQKL